MKISPAETKSADVKLFVIEFEQDPTNGIHEAYLSLNAIAAANRAKFTETFGNTHGRDEGGALTSTVSVLVNNNIDVFYNFLQRTARDKTREGVLTETVKMQAPEPPLGYLHDALTEYVEAMPRAVLSEMQSSMGNLTALTRTFEAVTADQMLTVIRESDVAVPSDTTPDKPLFGFGRVLFDPQV